MFVSPAKPSTASAAANKPRKLFLEEGSRALGQGNRPALPMGDLPVDLSPVLWVQAS